MAIINLVPHSVDFYSKNQFVNLEKLNPTTFVADGVEGNAMASYPSQGSARISTSTVQVESVEGLLTMRTEYGDLTGIPDGVDANDTLIVSLPTKSMATASGHPLANQMASPYGVVRQRVVDEEGKVSSGSTIYGAMGITF